MRKTYFSFITVILILFFLTGAVCFYESVSNSVLEAGKRCIFIVIPSLYLFSILASLVVKSNLLIVMARPFQKFCLKFLHTDAVLLMVIMFSQVGGYPVGTQILHSMYQDGYISEQQEQNMLCVCMGCGFGFLLGTVGGNAKIAFWLWMILSMPNILAGLLLIRNMHIEINPADFNQKSFSQIFTDSVESAASAMFKITAMVLAFSGFMGIIKAILPDLPSVINSILEVSCVTEYLQQEGSLAGAAGLLSFGGICVHLQNSAISGSHLHFGKFWLCRILIAGITYLVCFFVMPDITSESIPVFLLTDTVPVVQRNHFISACCLLIMSVFLLRKHYFFHKLLTNRKK